MLPIGDLPIPVHDTPMCVEFWCTLHDCKNSTHQVSSQLQTTLSVGGPLGEGDKQSSGRVKERIATSVCVWRDWKEGQGPWVKEGWGQGAWQNGWELQNETGASRGGTREHG